MKYEELVLRIETKSPDTKQSLEQIVSIEGFRLAADDESHCDLLIFELDSEDDFHEVLNREEEVFLTAKSTDERLLLKAIEAGVRGFFTQPFDEQQIASALIKFRDKRQQTIKNAKIISVVGSKGGIGTTTIAVNLAAILAEEEESSVCLLDLNPLCGELHLFLDFRLTHHWGEVIKSIDRLDTTLLNSALTKHRSGLYVLPAPSHVNGYATANSDGVRHMLGFMQKHFDYVVIDGGQKLNQANLGALEISKEILMVLTLSIPSLANTTQLMKELSARGYKPGEHVKLVVNRYSKNSRLTLAEAEKTLRTKVYWTIPDEVKKVERTIDVGKPLIQIAPKAPVTKSFYGLADHLFLPDEPKKGWKLF